MQQDFTFSRDLIELQKKSREKERRENLIEAMEENEASGKDCLSCEGTCCTFQANSMKVTPSETLDLVVDMFNKGRWNKEWKTKLENQVRSDRLGDDVPTDGRRDLIRRTYTCPFFKTDGSFGCSVERWKKPYGCLAFNPNEEKQTQGGNCSSHTDLLESHARDFHSYHEELDSILSKEYGISPSKTDLPSAILRFFDKNAEMLAPSPSKD